MFKNDTSMTLYDTFMTLCFDKSVIKKSLLSLAFIATMTLMTLYLLLVNYSPPKRWKLLGQYYYCSKFTQAIKAIPASLVNISYITLLVLVDFCLRLYLYPSSFHRLGKYKSYKTSLSFGLIYSHN